MKKPNLITYKYAMFSYMLLLFFSAGLGQGFCQTGEQYHGKVSNRVMKLLKEGSQVDVTIQFETPDMSAMTAGMTDKTAKGALVYNTLTAFATRTQAGVRKQLEVWGVPYKTYWVVNLVAARLNQEQIDHLSRRTEVKYIRSDAPVSFARPIPTRSKPIGWREAPEVTWGIRRILADSVWGRDIKGKGVVIGGQDTGYKWDVDGIKDKYRGFDGVSVDHNYNWHDAITDYNPINGDSTNPCGLNLKEPCDDHGHGTHTMGTMVGENDTLKFGVAPEARWVGCRCMERGWGKPSTYIDCFQWFIAPTDTTHSNPDPALAPAVINNSWGCPPNEGCNPDNFDIMQTVVDNVKAAGIVVVVSAGNDGGGGCATLRNPAAIYPSSFTVGALHPNDTIARFSSRGPVLSDGSRRTKPDITAPGVRVLSQLPDGSFRAWNGTSMAGPHVAGVVALMISANPALAGHVDEIEEIITSTARRKFSPQDSCDVDPMSVPNNVYGYGVINALEAVKKAIEWKPVRTQKIEISDNVRVSPNPTRGWITFEFMNDEDGRLAHITFADLNGKSLEIHPSFTSENYCRYDFSSHPSGIYFYFIHLPGKWITGRFVKR